MIKNHPGVLRYKRLVLLFLAFLYLQQTTLVQAHPSDMYFQTTQITLGADGMSVEWKIKPGPLLVNYIWGNTDKNENGKIDSAEADAWGRVRAEQLVSLLDAVEYPLTYNGTYFPDDLSALQAGTDSIDISLSAKWPQGQADRHTLSFSNQFEEQISINWFYVTASDGIVFETPSQRGGELTFQIRESASVEPGFLTEWDSGRITLPSGQEKDPVSETAAQVIPELQQNTPQGILTDLVQQKELSPQFYLLALGISIALGALHALTPGHGKTVVAAYLVGSRGTTKHAITLGSIVTLTHTGSVFLLGIVTLVASQYFLPTNLIPILEIVSGVLILGLGFSLFLSRWKNRLKKNHVHGHHHHDHEHDHSHNHEIPDTDQLTWKSLVTLGISGGLVPCPDAVAILLVAIAIQRIALGLSLILAFSFGLAIVLISIGLAMVHSRRLFNRMDAFNRIAPILPLVSAAAVMILGFALTYGAIVRSQGVNLFQQTEAGPATASDAEFDIREAQILYIGLDENDQKQVMLRGISGDNVRVLTHEVNGVSGFDLSPDATQFTYLSNRGPLDSDVWLYDLWTDASRKLVDCTGYLCWQTSWSPDGRQIIFEKMSMSLDENNLNLPSLSWLDVESGAGASVFQDASLPGYYPAWSPDGAWLGFRVPGGNIQLQNLVDNKTITIASAVSGPIYWSPDSSGFLFANGTVTQDRFVTRLFHYDLKGRESTILNNEGNFEDTLPAWSPDGKQIAFARRDVSTMLGEQIWTMNSDGSDPRQLTNSPASIHDGLEWSPDGRYLLIYEYQLDQPLSEPRIILIDVQNDKDSVLFEGSNPTWLVP